MMRIVTTERHYPRFKKWMEEHTCLRDSKAKMTPRFIGKDCDIYYFMVNLEEGSYTWNCLAPEILECTLHPQNATTKALLLKRCPKPPEAPKPAPFAGVLEDLETAMQSIEKLQDHAKDVADTVDNLRATVLERQTNE